jgi:3-hydroxybutyryl-CoA dehydrogenase
MMEKEINKIGLAGLGLMGQGISACLVAYGFNVIAYSRTAAREEQAIQHIGESLRKLAARGIFSGEELEGWESRFRYTSNLEELGECEFIIETVGESLDLKKMVFETLERVVGPEVVIATNTSGLPVSLLQKFLKKRDRFVGMHWAEPAEITKFMEIAPGKDTSQTALEISRTIGLKCGKEPTVLNFEVPGLISNRLMYAMMREAIHLVETGVADIETVDRSFRNDMGWWATICGPFRWMDLTGLKTYAKVMEGLFPDLCNSTDLPDLMKEKVESGTLFYDYSNHSMEEWEDAWSEFTHEIRAISLKYDNKLKL